MSPIRLHNWVFDILTRLYPGRYCRRQLPAIRPKRRSVAFEVDQLTPRESPTSLFAVDPITAHLVNFTAMHQPLPPVVQVGQALQPAIGVGQASQPDVSSAPRAFLPDVRLESPTYAGP